MKVYDRVKDILIRSPQTRNDDKPLIWQFWMEQMGKDKSFSLITFKEFMKCTHPETIRRTRQKIQEVHPELGPSESVEAGRAEKESWGGNFVFYEDDGQGEML